jgi:hypothetical protein
MVETQPVDAPRRAGPAVPDGPLGEPCECCEAGCLCGDCPDCLRDRPHFPKAA